MSPQQSRALLHSQLICRAFQQGLHSTSGASLAFVLFLLRVAHFVGMGHVQQRHGHLLQHSMCSDRQAHAASAIVVDFVAAPTSRSNACNH
eukprot:6470913-Amphidinium_carterae.1